VIYRKEKIEALFSIIQQELAKELPGENAHRKMLPRGRDLLMTSEIKKKAGVLLLLFPDGNSIQIAFIKRTEYEGVHSGQIGLPGGIKEKIDSNLLETAQRETEEEIGVFRKDIRIIGELSPIYIPVSKIQVFPFVGCVDFKPEFHPEPAEVDYMITLPVLKFRIKENIQSEKRFIRNESLEIPFFAIEEYSIWGATAMIIMEFLDSTEAIGQDHWKIPYSGSDCNDT